ncbi:30S ribosome-binding factor RbfA [Mesohalobacter halotolerans]|uniref:Ribosome-binding factor A n=1 Tax=Mesohalobacter halotolerans TaxID=1883405 RepID=A0A4U5TSH4_9FLAO|nr:30S ribosome-binding factor RbfA [Mesohalobacter halotolerans]MBS3738358.1 30S ribosome-binding factor RbfA [Psychroflexus sp.]TKS57249.1 30S ribosome-binding factor RbfA [Mesohalobacter halotolerans]
MESQRQQKISQIIQKDLAEIIQESLRKTGQKNLIISVTKVKVTPDMLEARAYLSVFPEDKTPIIMKEIKGLSNVIKHQLALRTKNQLRRVPEIRFFHDDTAAYVSEVEDAFKGKDNPIKNPDLLNKRKKS